jgi:hypothetical protein
MKDTSTVTLNASEAWVTYQALLAAKDAATARLNDEHVSSYGKDLAALKLAAIERTIAKIGAA